MSAVSFCHGCVFVYFCFKQKTAYEMRISDWSSDGCSSDLHHLEVAAIAADHRDEFVVAREDPPHAGGMVLHGLELVLVEFEDALEGGDHLLDEAALDHLHVGNDPAAVFRDRKSTRLNSSH